jgi:T-complex protein 1 subunit gamma
MISDLALEAVERVTVIEGAAAADGTAPTAVTPAGWSSTTGTAGSSGVRKDIDTKRYAKVEKLPGGELEECRVLDGVMCEKDVTHPKMRRKIENPRIILLDCPLEYKKAESATNLEVSLEADTYEVCSLLACLACFCPQLMKTINPRLD